MQRQSVGRSVEKLETETSRSKVKKPGLPWEAYISSWLVDFP